MELGLYTFGELTPDPLTGRTDPGARVRDLVEEIALADQVGLDVFGVGEHHRAEFAVSAPAVVLAAAAERTSRIRLTSAVSVISSDDPVRVFQQFATLDLLSGGRAEIMAGRGSFIESFALFGLDVFGVGEHHRPDFAVSAPAVVLAAAAERTSRIRLTSAVSVISSDDPVRVFQQFATLDLLSRGRAEIMAGRGSFIESFALFGHELRDYDDLFAEHLELLLRVRDEEVVSWPGGHRPAIEHRGVYPRPQQQPLPVWIAVGGTPESAVRAGMLGLPMALAIIGGRPERFAPLVDLFRRTARAESASPAR